VAFLINAATRKLSAFWTRAIVPAEHNVVDNSYQLTRTCLARESIKSGCGSLDIFSKKQVVKR